MPLEVLGHRGDLGIGQAGVGLADGQQAGSRAIASRAPRRCSRTARRGACHGPTRRRPPRSRASRAPSSASASPGRAGLAGRPKSGSLTIRPSLCRSRASSKCRHPPRSAERARSRGATGGCARRSGPAGESASSAARRSRSGCSSRSSPPRWSRSNATSTTGTSLEQLRRRPDPAEPGLERREVEDRSLPPRAPARRRSRACRRSTSAVAAAAISGNERVTSFRSRLNSRARAVALEVELGADAVVLVLDPRLVADAPHDLVRIADRRWRA